MEGGNARPGGQSSELTLAEYFSAIWRGWWLILISATVAALAALAAHLALPKRYEASAEFLIVSDEATSGDAERCRALLRSNRVFNEIIDRFDLLDHYGTPSRDVARKMSAKRAEFKISKGGLVTVVVTDADPQMAADMANAFVEVVGEVQSGVITGSVGLERSLLEKKGKRLEEELTRLSDSSPEADVSDGAAEGAGASGDAEGTDKPLPSGSRASSLASEQREFWRYRVVQATLDELLEMQLDLVKIEELGRRSRIVVVSEATVPDRPVGRGLAKSVVLAAFLGALLAVMALSWHAKRQVSKLA